MKKLFICTLAFVSTLLTGARAEDDLAKNFQNPPDSARPQTWWHWINDNITKEGITADLEAMKRIGLGGAQIFNVDCHIPPGTVKFMSPEWQDMIKHAVSEADRLGLELGIHNCSGWSSSGGPWITPADAMQMVVAGEQRVKGPAQFSGILPKPRTQIDYFHDIAVLAFPLPEGETVEMKDCPPKVTCSGTNSADVVIDGDDRTFLSLSRPSAEQPQYIQLEFPKPFTGRTLSFASISNMSTCAGVIQVSDDGEHFKDIGTFVCSRATAPLVQTFSFDAVTAGYFRMLFNDAGSRKRSISAAEISLSGRPVIEDLDAKAAFIREDKIPTTTNYFITPSLIIQRTNILDLTSHMDADGRLTWNVPPGDWKILRIGSTPTCKTNRPATPEGAGLECDKLSRKAMDKHFGAMMQTVLDDIGPLAGKTLKNGIIDSYEVGSQNWSPEFREEFRKRRGYDLLDFLPVFTGRVVDGPEISERFLWDVRRTIAELFEENYFGYFGELCHQRGLKFSLEPYGNGMFDNLASGGTADIPMGEFWVGGGDKPTCKLAASVAHINGRKIIGAESFTAQPNVGRWLNDPYSLKALGDSIYCLGVNRFIFHRYALQPWTNRWPGMTMGQWGSHLERTTTWWEQSVSWIKYLTRCQYLLQQGRFIGDICYFSGESEPSDMLAENPKPPLGYDYDGCDAGTLLKRMVVKNGRLTLRDGMSYRVLVLPPDETMTPPMLKKIAKLVADGTIVVGPKPTHSPSLQNFPKSDREVKKLADMLWGNCDGATVKEHTYGKGKVIWGKSLEEIFAGMSLKPDFEFTGTTNPKLAYIHRVIGDTDIYFVSNQSNAPVATECVFRVNGKVPELWHPETGRIEPAPVCSETDGRIRVPLHFDPAESVFVVFRQKDSGADHVVAATRAEASADAQLPPFELGFAANARLELRAWEAGKYDLKTASGKQIHVQAASVAAPLDISGPWELRFPPNWGAPEKVQLNKLASWTENEDAGVRYFSGTATYFKEFEIPATMIGKPLYLDLGEVKNLAGIKLNGKDLGVLWKPPFRVEITGAARTGTNRLEIRVTNLWPNRLIGDEQLPDDREWKGKELVAWPDWLLAGKPSPTGRFTFTTWHHWTKDSPLLPSGLFGPVTVRAVELLPIQLK